MWDVGVIEGAVSIHRIRGEPQVSTDVEEHALRSLAMTAGGVVGVHVLTSAGRSR